MMKVCVPEQFCGPEDILVLQEFQREITGEPAERRLPRNASKDEVNLRLMEVRGIFWNRKPNFRRLSLDGIRMVLAVMKNSEIVTASSPSDPLICRSHGVNEDAVKFEARWSQGGAVLPFDNSSSDCSPFELAANTRDPPCEISSFPPGV